MTRAIKVRRAGIERIFRKKTFRAWLDEQPRSILTYRPKGEIERRDGKGWTTEDFMRQSWHLGLDVHIGTAWRWMQGSKPRPFVVNELRKAFPTIKF